MNRFNVLRKGLSRKTAGELIQKSFVWTLLISFLVTSSTPAYARPAVLESSSVDHGNGSIEELAVDFYIRVLGGYTGVYRHWNGKGWVFNPTWGPLELHYDSENLSYPTRITRGGSVYFVAFVDGEKRYTHGSGHQILSGGGGFTWEGLNKEWMKYDSQGRALSWGNELQQKNTILRDNEDRISGLKDHYGKEVFTFHYDLNGRVESVSDYSGRVVSYGYNDESGRISSVTDADGKIWTFQYGGSGELLQKTDPEGRETIFEYSREKNAVRGITRGRLAKSYAYSSDTQSGEKYLREEISGKRIKERRYGESGELVEYVYNGRKLYSAQFIPVEDGYEEEEPPRAFAMASGGGGCGGCRRMWANTDPWLMFPPEEREFLYEMGIIPPKSGIMARSRIRSVNVSGRHMKLSTANLGASNRVESETSPSGKTAKYTGVASAPHRPEEVVSVGGTKRKYTYGQDNRVESIKFAYETSDEREVAFTYDGDNQLDTVTLVGSGETSPQDRSTTYTYDDYGNVASVTDSRGMTSSYVYDAAGNVTEYTDGRGKIWKYEYDAAGNLKKTIDPLLYEENFSYDDTGNLRFYTDELSKVTEYVYDNDQNLTEVIDALGNSWLYEYDEFGQLIREEDPEGQVEEYEYDIEGRLIRTVDANGSEEIFGYIDGLESDIHDGGKETYTYGSVTTEWSYDEDGLLVEEVQKPGVEPWRVTRYEYDDEQLLSKVTNPYDVSSEFTYNKHGMETHVDFGGGDTLDVSSSNWLHKKSYTDGAGQTRQFEVSTDSMQTIDTLPGGGTYTNLFDNSGLDTSIVDPLGNKRELDYDDASRIEEVRLYAAGDHVKTITYTFTPRGELASYDDGSVDTTYTYDDVGRLLSTTVDYGAGFSLGHSYTYYKNGQTKTYTGPDGIQYSYGYDAGGRLRTILLPLDSTNVEGTISVNSFQHDYPKEVVFPGGGKQENGYNESMEVNSVVTRDPAGNILLAHTYQRDLLGNVVGKSTEHGDYSYTYDDENRLATAQSPGFPDENYTYDGAGNRNPSAWVYGDNNKLEQAGAVSYTYDSGGNLKTRTEGANTKTFFYDSANNLILVEENGSTIAEYGYDPGGQRRWKKLGATTTYYYYAAEGLVGEFDSSGNVIRSYGYFPESTNSVSPLFLKQGTQYYYYTLDHRGTPQKLVARSGEVVWSAEYSAYGEANTAGSVTSPWRLPGQFYDAETGLHYNKNRYYDPETGRYTQVDRHGLLGDPNAYLYAAGNPVSFGDPTGNNLLVGGILGGYKGYVDHILDGYNASAPGEYNNVFDYYLNVNNAADAANDGMIPGIGNGVKGMLCPLCDLPDRAAPLVDAWRKLWDPCCTLSQRAQAAASLLLDLLGGKKGKKRGPKSDLAQKKKKRPQEFSKENTRKKAKDARDARRKNRRHKKKEDRESPQDNLLTRQQKNKAKVGNRADGPHSRGGRHWHDEDHIDTDKDVPNRHYGEF